MGSPDDPIQAVVTEHGWLKADRSPGALAAFANSLERETTSVRRRSRVPRIRAAPRNVGACQ
jgi:hypothetical protein